MEFASEVFVAPARLFGPWAPTVDSHESELVQRIAEGDRTVALADLYGRYARRLYGYGLRIVGDAGSAEEVVQETFLRAWRSSDRFDPGRGSVRSWLFSIAHYAAIDVHRKRARVPMSDYADVGDPADDASPLEDLVLSLTVRDALDSLPAAQREVLELAYVRHLTQTEVADRLNIPLGTVKSRTFTALKALKSALQERGIDG